MCGIIAGYGKDFEVKSLIKAINKIGPRGKNGYGIKSDEINFQSKSKKEFISKLSKFEKIHNFIFHNLHSIVNYRLQPINNEFATNCEIYNWKQLNLKYNLNAENDADLLYKFLKLKQINSKNLEELDGDYTFVYDKGVEVKVARDILGIKPLWFHASDFLLISSEKKALECLTELEIEELDPRKILCYNRKNKELVFIEREFFSLGKTDDYKKIKEKIKGLLINAIAKRIPEKKLGLLFSGGVDSTIIALILKQLGIKDIPCYVAAFEDGELAEAQDLIYAKKAAEILNLNLKIVKVKISDVKKEIGKVVKIIEDTNVVKVGVALPFYFSAKAAKRDGVKVLLTGLGSEEIFAGYERHLNSQDINKECLSGLLKIHERDLYRDDVITMYHNIELRVPFLDVALVREALRVDSEYKIKGEHKKVILREISEELGLTKEFAWRKKTAAQYGSKFDKAIEKLAKIDNKIKSEYLKQFYKKSNLKLGVLFSGGKDSIYSAFIMKRMNYELSCLITINSKNQESYMFHTPTIEWTKLQAEAMQLPLIIYDTLGEKEKELEDLEKAILLAKEKYKLDGIITGALFSQYQRDRIEKICIKQGLKIFSPLWHKDQFLEMRELFYNGFRFMLSAIAADGLNSELLGKILSREDVERIISLSQKYKFNAAGEGGEFESFVVDCPIFHKKIEIVEFEKEMEKSYLGRLIIKKARLVEK